MTYDLTQSTVRDFGGGWDVSDSDKSLSSKYQPISDNIVRATDGSFSVRLGTRLFADMKQGVETVQAPIACTVSTIASASVPLNRISDAAIAVCTVTTPADIAKFYNGLSVTITGGTGAGMTNANGTKVIASVNTPVNTFQLVGTDTSAATADQTTGTMNASTLGTGVIKIVRTAHGLTSGDHINITSWTPTIGGITQTDMLGYHGVRVIDANTFTVYVRKLPTTSATGTVTIGWNKDTHALSGTDIYGRYYKDNIFVFSDTGEVVKIDINGTVTPVWNHNIAQTLATSVPPWSNCRRISAEIVKGRLIAVNGATNDKPIEIVTSATTGITTCNYLVNEAAVNTAIPRADFIIAADRYVLLISTENGPTKIDISAKDTYYTFSADPNADDAAEIDLGMVTAAVDTTILGANVIRSRVFIAFHDRSSLGELGHYDSLDNHDPDFKDSVSMLGSFSHRSIICLGNDLFCAAINGIQSLAISTQSGEYTPTTISDLIHPVMLRHLGRLTEDDRRYKTFAVWDSNSRQYMFFAPKYSDVTYTLPDDPILAASSIQPHNLMYLLFPSHSLDAGDYITISGVANSGDDLISGVKVNGTRRIRAVVDENTVAIEVDAYQPEVNYSFGGNAVTIKPVNDETPCYVFEYNSRLKIRRWTRFRGWDFDWGAVSQLSKLFFGKNGRVYRYGNASDRFSADKIGDYNKRTWALNTAYVVGDRILDPTYKMVFEVTEAHTTPASGTFHDARAAHPLWYEEFPGFPIKWELESSWTDFKDRSSNKQVEVVRFDTKGSSEFEFSLYTNSQREDFVTWELIPNRTTVFIGQDAPGFGAGTQPWGGGRNTRQEWLRGMPVYGKLFRLRFAGSSIKPLTISAATMYYHKSKVLT